MSTDEFIDAISIPVDNGEIKDHEMDMGDDCDALYQYIIISDSVQKVGIGSKDYRIPVQKVSNNYFTYEIRNMVYTKSDIDKQISDDKIKIIDIQILRNRDMVNVGDAAVYYTDNKIKGYTNIGKVETWVTIYKDDLLHNFLVYIIDLMTEDVISSLLS